MAEQFRLICECGKVHAVSAAQAGGIVGCRWCGKEQKVPALTGLRQLQPLDAASEGAINLQSEVGAPSVLRPRIWQSAWLLGLLLASITAAAVWVYWPPFGPTRPLPEIDLADADPEVLDAVEAARKAVRRTPRNAQSWGNLAMVLHGNGFENAAEYCYAAAADLDPREPNWPYLTGCLHQIGPGGPEAAIPLFERAANLDSSQSLARLRLAEMLLAAGRLDDAQQEFSKLQS